MPDATEPQEAEARIRIDYVRIHYFRCIRDLCVPLDDLTILVGPNNVGKSTFLRALEVAIGGARPTDDDLHVDETHQRDDRFVIDLRIVPADNSERFEEPFAVRYGTAVRLPADGPEFVTLRTIGREGTDGSGPTTEQWFLDGWTCDPVEAEKLTQLDRPNREQLRLISFFLLDASRDIVDELRQRRSYWGRLLSNVGINAIDKAELEEELRTLGEAVVGKSAILTTLRDELDNVKKALGSAVSAVSIEALPARIEEVARAVDILLAAPGSAALPLRLQGLGSRSLAVVMVFQAFTRLRLGADQDIKPLPVSAFEEPEAHLHPHPQRPMLELIDNLPGQKLVSTHSPYVPQLADLFNIRAFTRDGGTIACQFVPRVNGDGTPSFEADALDLVRRFVQRNNGEVLFARLVVLFEGDTESGALPVLARARWDIDPSAHGVSLIDAQGGGNFKHFVRVLEYLGIPWVILCDGDDGGNAAIKGVENALGRAPTPTEVFMLPAGENFETYLVSAGYQDQLRAAIVARDGPTALDDYKNLLHGQPRSATVVRDYASAGWEDRLLADYCRDKLKNASGGSAIAEAILASVEAGDQPSIPLVADALLARADIVLGIVP